MNISPGASHHTVSTYHKEINTQSKNVQKSVFVVGEVVEDVQELSSVKKSPDILHKEITGKYNVRNATFEEIVEIAKLLYEAGEITSDELGFLVFDFERATNYLKQNAPGVPSNFSMYETTADSNGRRDWIAEFGARASKNFMYGNLIGFQSNKKFHDILEQLEGKVS